MTIPSLNALRTNSLTMLWGSRRVLLLFATTLFLSALLLFWSQLVIAKMLLPRLGGTPAVWNTCMLFFQVLLLGGYSYALVTTTWFGTRAQVILHSSVILLSLLYLPLSFVGNVGRLSVQDNPALALFAYLLGAIGLPIFLISTTSPLLQKWFTRTGHVSANDPYFLFAVSNAGSLIALLSYPLFLEPNFKLSLQNELWVVVYVVFLVLSLACVLVLWRSPRSDKVENQKRELTPALPDQPAVEKPSNRIKQRLYWTLLAFIPSSLLFGVTSYITTEIAPTPLLWTIPLALYLGTFVLAFARTSWFPEQLASNVLGGLALLLTLVIAAEATEPTSAIVLLHLCFFVVAAMLCHTRLANDRPAATRLAEFYLCVAIGGMLGGLFNTLIAPTTFNTLVEYPLVVVLACLMRQRENVEGYPVNRLFDIVLPLCAGLLTVVLALLVQRFDLDTVAEIAVVFGIPLVLINHLFRKRPVGFALALGAVMLGSIVYSEIQSRTLHVERNFLGTLSVRSDPASATNVFFHGNTIHGRQFTDPGLQSEPLSYFHRDGPLGQIFAAFNANRVSPNVAVVGLGIGSMACYAFQDQDWTFYEINPAVVSIAQTTEYFTYLQRCAPANSKIILGDARLQLQNAPDRHYGLIVLDAFNSDAVPVHLMTREAITLYMSKLAPGGMLAFNVSNRSLKLDAVLADLAKHTGSMGLGIVDAELDRVRGKDPSEWVVMARQSAAFDTLAQQPRWRRLEARAESHVWTDDFSNILSAFRWY
jgi:spermidine synthase